MDDFFDEEQPQVETKQEDLVITEEFQKAFDIAEHEDGNLFVTGDAGTGKSTWLKWFLRKTKKKVVTLAPTGIAAVNVGGQTIHSFFKWPPKPMTSHDMHFMPNDEIYRELDVIVIDEISMVRVDLIDLMSEFLQINRNDPRPFGGAQVILIGDLLQLPPVTKEDMDYLRLYERYGCEFFFAADIWNEAELNLIKFTQIFRQSDPKFIEVLNKIRSEKMEYADLDELNARTFTPEDEANAAYLCSVNVAADKINAARLAKLNTEERSFEMFKSGKTTNIAKFIPEILTLKIGCKVMMLANDSNGRFQNGTIGYVEGFGDQMIQVNIYGQTFWVGRKKWESKRHRLRNDRIETETDGEVEQFPMKVAYAISIHKSQAQTFDVVIIDMGNGAFASGMGYTAISRVRTREKLFFAKPLKKSDLFFDPKVIKYLETGKYVREN